MMSSYLSVIFGSLIISLHHLSSINAQCHDSLQGTQGSTIYVWSDNKTDANSAQQTCSSMGGRLAHVGIGSQNILIPLMKKKYNQGMSTVEIYVKPFGSRALKYRGPRFNDPELIGNWHRPSQGQLRSIQLFSSATGDFNQIARFCYFSGRDKFRRMCDMAWKLNFDLYDGSRDTNETIELRSIFVRPPGSSIFLLPGQSLPAGYKATPPSENQHGVLYIPDNSVFIGARSDMNKTNWFWSDRIPVNDTNYLPSNASLCQQMSWPLTYDNGINLLQKQCDIDLTYFLCQFKFTPTLSAVQCNGSTLRLSWNPINFVLMINNQPNLMVEVFIQGTNRTSSVPYSASKLIITDLIQRREYVIQALLVQPSCRDQLTVGMNVTAHTSYGIPDPVTSAKAQNSISVTNECIISWRYDPLDLNITSYQIFIESANSSSTIMVNNLKNNARHSISEDKTMFNYLIDLSSFGYNTTVYLKIQAMSCQGGSEVRDVEGFCITPQRPEEMPPTRNVGMFAGIGVGIACLLLFIIVAVVSYRRKSRTFSREAVMNNNTPPNEASTPEIQESALQTPPEINAKKSKPVSEQNGNEIASAVYANFQTPSNVTWIKDFEENYFVDKEQGFQKLKKEFQEIQTYTLANEPLHEVAKQAQNKKKNRYKNIYPYDHSRIMLHNERYINASLIEDFSGSKSFIATQGPKPNSVEDFWEMIWMQNSSIIIMLCNCLENGKTKCEQYWPSKSSIVQYGSYKIKSKSERNIGEIIKRIFVFSKQESEEQKTVVQFHFILWPDHDVPITSSGMTLLRNLVNSEHVAQNSQSPIIVHCSAGAGRTGTYIAVDNCMEELDATGKVDIKAAILKMRENRKSMVQTANQYIFVHQLLMENCILPSTDILITEFLNVMSQINWETKLESEFELFSRLTSERYFEGEENVYQNEFFQQTINARNQVKILVKNQEKPIKMDAHFINTTRYPGAFIASASPRAGREHDFWTMVAQNNTKIVVALESTNDDVLTSTQKQNGETIDLGRVVIIVQQVTESNSLLIQKLSVSFPHSSTTPVNLTHVFIRCWKEALPPPSVNHFMEIIAKMRLSMKVTSGSTALVYCFNGKRRTGLFLAIADSIELIKSEKKVDIFRTVKDLRDMRCGMLDSMELYKSCYLMISEYLATIAI